MAKSPRHDRVRKVANELSAEILSDHLRPGMALPSPDAIAAERGVEVGVAREAIRDLWLLNLIELLPDDSAVVRDWRRSGELTLLPHLVALAPKGPEKVAVIAELLHVRRLVLAEAAGFAADRAKAADLDELRALVSTMRENKGDSAMLLDLDRQFLRRLIDATQSPPMRWMANSFFDIYGALMAAAPEIWTLPPNHFSYLDELLAAIESRDADETAQVVRRHHERTDPLVIAVIRHRLG